MSLTITQRTANGISLVPIESKAYEQRTLYLNGEIGEETSIEFIKELLELNRQDQQKPIKVLISSPGGSVQYGLACYDAIVTSKAPVYTYCIGMAASMAGVLFLSGSRRYILRNSTVMLHQPLVGKNNGGNTESITSLANSLKDTQNQLVDIICTHTGMTRKKVNKEISYDHFYSSEEAVNAHIADEIVGLDQII